MTEPSKLRILGMGTAVPEHSASQERVAGFMTRVLEANLDGPDRERVIRLTQRIYASSGVSRRHSVIADFQFDDPAHFRFFPADWSLEPFPSTADRMRLYERCSVDLAADACRRAIVQAGVSAGDITHVVVSSCTGFFAPGPDVLLLERLGMPPSVKRTVVGFMGCYAGLSALRVSADILGADPNALVLQVCVELCSLHYQKSPDPQLLVANCLFADGCAALVHGRPERWRRGLADLLATASHVESHSLRQIAWRIGDHGFEMRLSPEVPATLGSRAPGFVDYLLDRAGRSRDSVHGWAIHPGGPKILAVLRESLQLGEEDLADSCGVLRDYGNMSSGTVFFVLERLLQSESVGGSPGGSLVAVGFGPGLTFEGAVLEPLADRVREGAHVAGR